MKLTREEIITELQSTAELLNKSPGRRDFSYQFYQECLRQFGSFNQAKEVAKLPVYRRSCELLPARAYEKTLELVKIMSYVTFDGHLYDSLKAFYLSSKYIYPLKDFEQAVQKQFDIKGDYRFNTAGSKKQTHKIFFFNTNASKLLYEFGVPKGDKMLTTFTIPKWIQENEQYSKEYIKIAFLCEGHKTLDSRSIFFNLNKSEELLHGGIRFIESVKKSLSNLNIETGKTSVRDHNLRKRDGKRTKTMRFRVKSNSVNRFIKTIGWMK